MRATLFEIETQWSLADLADAHDALDELEAAFKDAQPVLDEEA